MNFDSSLMTYFLNAGLVVKLVMMLLLTASIVSWTYIFQRYQYLKNVRNASNEFESRFWSGADLSQLYTDSMRQKAGLNGTAAIFQAGFKEFTRLNQKPGVNSSALMESVKRAMRGTQMREQDKIELHLPLLATIGSISPYVGLFGTVWGIMLSFRALANVQQATIAMVAPGIAEALVATAMGLFAAIPAVIAYNRFMNDINRQLNQFDVFQDEFSNILFRQAQQQAIPQSEFTAEAE